MGFFETPCGLVQNDRLKLSKSTSKVIVPRLDICRKLKIELVLKKLLGVFVNI